MSPHCRSAAAAVLSAALALAAAGCAARPPAPAAGEADTLDRIADDYVRLVLAVGRHDPSFVDAYYGPPEWKAAAAAGEPRPLSALIDEAAGLRRRLGQQPAADRRTFLDRQLVAVDGFLRRLRGARMSLAEEARVLYDIAPPECPSAVLESARAEVDRLLPGPGSLSERMAALRQKVEVDGEHRTSVVDAALAETRRRTAERIELPAGESFRVEYVTGKPWGAYNWYQGNFQSLIQFNADRPSALDALVDTVAHEGYPGHHVFNALLERDLVRGRGWREFTIYPLHSPQSLIAEGTANAAMDAIMTRDEQHAFLARLAEGAGIAREDLERYLRVKAAAEPLACASSVAVRLLLDEGRPEEEVEEFLVHYGSSPPRARQNIRFFREYRSYVFTYTAGERLVRDYVAAGPEPVKRFFDLLNRPVVPSQLGGRDEPRARW